MAAINTSPTVAEMSLAAHFDAVEYVPHVGQRKFHASGARHRVIDAGRRLGKSFMGGHELSYHAMLTWQMLNRMRNSPLENPHRRNEIWIVGPEYSDAEKEFRVLWNDAKRLELPLDRPGSYYNAEAGDMVMSLWGGKFLVHGKSAKYPSTLVGEGLYGVIMAEAAKLKPSVWTKYIRPTLIDYRGWSIWASTPEGKNHFYEAWQRGQDPEHADWESWRMPSYLNTFVFPEGKDDPELEDMKREMTPEMIEQEIEASFTDFVGLVFKEFDEEYHVNDCVYDPTLPIYIACDYGWTNPFVALAIQIDVWDNINVLFEYRAERRDILEIADDLNDSPVFRNAVTLYPDPAEPQDTAVLAKKLRVSVNKDTGGPLKYRLQMIRKWLKPQPEHLPDGHPEKLPKLFINRRCKGLISEMTLYRYPDNPSEVRPNKEEPMDKDDHGPEALGRFMRGYFGPGVNPAEKQRGRVRKARLRS